VHYWETIMSRHTQVDDQEDIKRRLEAQGFTVEAIHVTEPRRSRSRPFWRRLLNKGSRPLDRLDRKQLDRCQHLTHRAATLLEAASESEVADQAADLVARATLCLRQAAETAETVDRWIDSEPAAT
jgi:hypothetical protein